MLHSEDVVQKKDSNLVFRLLELEVLGSNGMVETTDQVDDGDDDDDDAAATPTVAWWGETPPKRGQVHR